MSDSSGDRGKNSGTLLAFLMLIVLSGLLLLLIAVVFPNVLGLVSVVLGIFLFCAFHYVVWGHWLADRLSRTDIEEDDRRDEEHLRRYGPR